MTMTLFEHHRQKLLSCGLTSETWSRARLHSGSVDEVREILGYGGAGTGLVIPYDERYSRVRIDHPGPDGKRYRSPRGQGNHLYVPPILEPAALTDFQQPLYVTEGEFKALKATLDGFPTVALPGVWSWKTRLHGQSLPIPDLGQITWKGRTVIVVFDSDLAEKPMVAWAEHSLCQELRRRGAQVFVLRLPDGPRGEKLGLDDYLVAHGVEAVRRLPMQSLAEADHDAPTFLRVRDLVDAYLVRVLQPHHRIDLGYGELRQVLRGVAPGETMTILGRASVGKTAFALNLIERMTVEGQLPTLVFSLEQPGLELFERMASITIGWSGREIEDRARLEDPQLTQHLVDVCRRWEHVVVVEKPCTLDQIDSLIETARASELWAAPLRLVVVDYMGLIGARRPTSPYEHMSQAARELKNIAKRHRVALVTLCQVDREGASGGEPITLRMARDSGVIEEAADYLLGIWRPELREGLSRDQKLEVRGQFKLRVLKNRHGPAPRTVTLSFEDTTLRITSAGLTVDA
jgi:LmbE family N-acetylglucosaminyl deacetylase